jgi:hypothetical protein
MGFLKKAGPLASMATMVIPGVGAAGTIAGAAAGTGVASVAGMVKPRSEVAFEYKLMAPDHPTAVLENAVKSKAKENDDVISHLIEQAATDILAKLAKK